VDARAVASGEPSRGVEFALDSFDVAGGRLVVSGRWYGVTGRRFVRPTLQAEGQRRRMALLEHKPWPAEEGARWLAAFPDDGYLGTSRLQVAPDIAVELPPAGPEAGDGRPQPARLARPPVRRGSGEAVSASPAMPPTITPTQAAGEGQAARRTAGLEGERDAALAEIEAIRQELEAARADADRLRAELDQARSEAERAHVESDQTDGEADRLRTELSHVRTEAHRAAAERNAAQAELERLRRPPARHPYIAPRPMAFRDIEPGPSWRVRVVATLLVLAVFVALIQLLFGVF
jgi:hypothetical protein